MIAQTNPLITAAAVSLAVAGSSMVGTTRQVTRPERLSGVLYSASTDTRAARTSAASMPEINVGLDPAARDAFPSASALIVRLVDIDQSTFTLTLAHHFHENSSPKGTSARSSLPLHRRSRRQVAIATERVVDAAAAIPVSTPTPVAAEAPPLAPKPTFPPTFAEIDNALRASSTAQAINFRVKKGGVTFRLTQVGRVGDRYVIRYAIANEESSPFFLSIINVAAGGKPVLSETAGTYSCSTGQEVYGVVHFSPAAVAGKSVVVELVQSGGEHRRFSLTADYAF